MTVKKIDLPYKLFFDTSGNPLKSGKIYVGENNLNPETNPISVYFDSALTIPAAQPITTINGYISNNGSPADIFTASNYSITVRDKNNNLIYTKLTNEFSESQTIDVVGEYTGGVGTFSDVITFLNANTNTTYDLLFTGSTVTLDASVSIPSNVRSLVFGPDGSITFSTYDLTLTSQFIDAPTNKQVFIYNSTGTLSGVTSNEFVVPEWWGAVGDGSTDCYQPIQRCINFAGGLKIKLCSGTYLLKTGQLSQGLNDLSLMGSGVDETILKIDSSNSYFTSVSREMIVAGDTGSTITESSTFNIPVGTDNVTLTSVSGVLVGDLIQMTPNSGQGELRKVARIDGTTIYFDAGLYLPFADGIGTVTINVKPQRSTIIKNLTFDTDSYDAGHAGVTIQDNTYTNISDVNFITGGQHGVYTFGSHTIIKERIKAWDFNKRASSWTPSLSGESLITASISNLAGEGYGVGIAGFNVTVRDCYFSRCRHAISGGLDSYTNTHILYHNNFSYRDLSGAYDMHQNSKYVLLDSNKAAQGFSGGYLRGPDIKIINSEFTEEKIGIFLFENITEFVADNNVIIGGEESIRTRSDVDFVGLKITNNTLTNPSNYAVWFEGEAKTLKNVKVNSNHLNGGKQRLRFDGTFEGCQVRDNNWYGSTTITTGESIMQFRPPNATFDSVVDLEISGNRGDLGSADFSRVINFNSDDATLTNGVYDTVYVQDNRFKSTGTVNGFDFVLSSAVIDNYVSLNNTLSGVFEQTAFLNGADTPEGAVIAPVGSVFCRTNGGGSSTFYVKESGTGNTGWVAK